MHAVRIDQLSHAYGSRRVLQNLSLQVGEGEIFGLLGPNGSGKTTLFRILSTLVPVSEGAVAILDHDLSSDLHAIRRQIGVVFQSPSLDKKLTVIENLRHQGHLYGLSGATLRARMLELLERGALMDRANEMVETLSGGLQRRVEIVKAMLHEPRLLLMDEPGTGLDPLARKELNNQLESLRKNHRVTILLTTHLLDEAGRCDRIGILDEGRLVALDSPDALRARIGGEMIIARARDPVALCEKIRGKFGGDPRVLEDSVRFEKANGHEFIARLVESFPGQIEAITIGKPTLEDVFIQLTGHRFRNGTSEEDRTVATPHR